MIIGLIISGVLAVIFLCLYVSAVQDNASLNKDNEWLRKQRDEKSAEAAPQTAASSQKLPLTSNNIGEAVRFNGIIPEQINNTFYFKVQGEKYALLFHEDVSVVEVYKGYSCEYEDFDFDLFKQAAKTVEDEYLVGKIRVLEKDDNNAEFGIEFQVSGFELYYEHFRDDFSKYINAINQIIAAHREEYNKLLDAKQSGADLSMDDSKFSIPSYAKGWDA